MKSTVIERDYVPNDKQSLAHASTARWVCFGGAWGGGKTRWLAEECLQLMLDYQGIEGIIARYDFADIMEPTQIYDVFHQYCPHELVAKQYKGIPVWTRLTNGSRVMFTGLKEYKASAEFGFIAVDQAEEVPGETLELLDSRLRQTLPNGSRPHYRALITCNPAPGWIKERFVDALLLPEEERDPSYQFIPALPTDNLENLPGDYIERMRGSLTTEAFARFIEGSWAVFKGQAISEYDQQRHVVEPFDYWRSWPVYRGIDWGLSSATVCLWFAISPDGHLFCVQEYYRENAKPSDNAQAIAALSLDMNIVGTWIDPRVAEVKANMAFDPNWSVWHEFQKHGVYAQLARGERTLRLAAWKEALKLDPRLRDYRTLEPPAPRLYIFRTCTNLLRELPELQYSTAMQGDAKDEVLKTKDHAYDAGGFVLVPLLKRYLPGQQVKERNYIGVRVPAGAVRTSSRRAMAELYSA